MNMFFPTLKSGSWNRLGLLAAGVGLLSFGLMSPAFTQEKLLKSLTVTGRGTEMVVTTLAQVRLGVESQGKTAKEVQQEVARRSNAVVTLLKARNVEKLETTGVNLRPNYRYDNGTQTLTGYTASNTVSFQISINKAGNLLDEAVKAGATRIDGISFIASDAAIASARNVALREATEDAQSQADAVLGSLGLTRKEVVNIQIGGAMTPPPRPVFAESADNKLSAAPPPIIGGEQQVEASVTLQISY